MATAPFAVGAALAAGDDPFPTDLLFDPDTSDDRRPLIRISEVLDAGVTDLDERERQRVVLKDLYPNSYELWLDAFGPATQYQLRIFETPGCYDLILSGVRLGELRDATLTLEFRRRQNVWFLGLSGVGELGLALEPVVYRSFIRFEQTLDGVVSGKSKLQAFSEIFDGHVRATGPLKVTIDRNLVWHATGTATPLTCYDEVAKLGTLEFKWARRKGASNSGPTEFVANADADCGRISLGGGTLGPCLELKPDEPETRKVRFAAGIPRKGENPRMEVRLSTERWSATISENGPILGPISINGVVTRQRLFRADYEPGAGDLTSTVAAGIVQNLHEPPLLVTDPECQLPPDEPDSPDGKKPAKETKPDPDLLFVSVPSAIGTIEVSSPETEEEAGEAEANGTERPFWAYAAANAKGRLVLQETNISLLLRRANTALPGATTSSLSFANTAFQLLYRQSGDVQLPASYFWLGAKCLIAGTPRARIDLTRARLKASRSTDMVSLGFRFSDFCLVYDWLDKKPRPEEIHASIRIEPLPDYCRAIRREGDTGYHDTRPLLVVEFPRQHVMEEALFQQELPPLPTRTLEPKKDGEGKEGDKFPPFDPAHPDAPRWYRDPRKLIEQISGLRVEERAEIKRQWLAATAPTDPKEPAEVAFQAFVTAYLVEATKDPDVDARTKPLPVDQQIYIGPYGLDADAMAIGRRILEKDRATYTVDLVDNMLRVVTEQGKLLIDKATATPGDTVEGALEFEHLLETSVPAYQLFRDHYRQVMIEAVLGEPSLPWRLVPGGVAAAEIEFFAIGGELKAQLWSNRGFLSVHDRIRLEERAELVIAGYKKALAASNADVPEVLRGRLSEPSRLAFRVNCGPASGTMGKLPEAKGRDFIAFNLDGLTDWSKHELSVVRRSQRLIDPERSGLLPTPDRRHVNIDDNDVLAFQGFSAGPFITPQQRLGEVVASLRHPPTRWETSIELPARLILSTAQDAVWRTPKYFDPAVFWRKYGPIRDTPPAVDKQQSNLLATSEPPRGGPATLWAAGIDPDAEDPGLRVVHSPDFRPEFLWSRSQRLEGKELLDGTGIRLPGNGAPPRGPFAPWLIGREQLDTPPPSDDDLEAAFEKVNPDLSKLPDTSKTFEAACPPKGQEPKRFWLSLSKYLFDRKALLKRYGKAVKFRTTLDAYDRHELVILSSAYGLPVLGRRQANGKLVDNSGQFEPGKGYALEGLAPGSAVYQPRTLNLRELTLTAIGGNLRHDTSFLPPASAQTMGDANLFDALSIERWQHWTVLGRDVFTEVVYKGFLFPLGQRASLVKLTERVFMRASGKGEDDIPNGAVKAYLRQRMYIRVGKPEKEFPAIGQPNGGRQFPVGEVRILTAKTPDIVDPTAIAASNTGKDIGNALPTGRLPLPGAPGLAFWPRTAMTPDADIVFDITLDGRLTRLPLIFVDNTAAHDPESLAAIVKYYNARVSPDENAATPNTEPDSILPLTHKRTIKLAGQGIRYCDERKEGDSTHETVAWTIKAQGRSLAPKVNDEGDNSKFSFDPVMEGAEQPPFYPVLETARILLRQTERFSGRPATPSVVQFDGHYVANGFEMEESKEAPGVKFVKGNASEIYLNLVRPMKMTIGNNGDRSGGMFRPESDFVAVSRLKGPIGGSPEGRETEDQLAADKLITKSGELISRVDAYPRLEESEIKTDVGHAKLVQAYKRYFALDTKLLGLIPLNKLLQYMGLPTPEDGMPLLKEALDYGIAQAGEALKEVDQASNAGRSAVQDEVIAPLLKVVQQVRGDWDKAQKQIAAAQNGTAGQAVTLDTLFPEIAQGLNALEQALKVAMGTTALVPFFASLADIYEAGRQLIAGLKRAASNAGARVNAAIREKIGALTDQITGKLGEAQDAIKAAGELLLEQAATMLVDALIPPGNDGKPITSFLPSKPEYWPFDLVHGFVDEAWEQLTKVPITNGDLRAFLRAIVLNDREGKLAFIEPLRNRFIAAEAKIPKDAPLFVSQEEVEELRQLLHSYTVNLENLIAKPDDRELLLKALPTSVAEDVKFVLEIADQVKALQTALADRKPADAARAGIAIVNRLAGSLGLYDEINAVKSAANNVLQPIVAAASKALTAPTFCVAGSTTGSDDLCDRLHSLSEIFHKGSESLEKLLNDPAGNGIPPTGELRPLHDVVDALQKELLRSEGTVNLLRANLVADAATTRAFLAELPEGSNFFDKGEMAGLLDNFRQMAAGKAKLAGALAKGLDDLTKHAKKIKALLEQAVSLAGGAVAEAKLPPNPIESLQAALGSLFVGSAQAAPTPGEIKATVKDTLSKLEKDTVPVIAKAYEYALKSLHDISSAAGDTIDTGNDALRGALTFLQAELDKAVSAVSPGRPTELQNTLASILASMDALTGDLKTILDVAIIDPNNSSNDGKIDVNADTFKKLFEQAGWSAKMAGRKLHEVFDIEVPRLRENAEKLEAQVSQLAEQAGRSLVGLGKSVIERQLPKAINVLLNGFPVGSGNGLKDVYAALVTARKDARDALAKAGLPTAIAEDLKGLMMVPPVNGDNDQLTADAEVVSRLAEAAKKDPSDLLSNAATYKELRAFIAGWENGNASPLVIARNVENKLQELLRGEWFKLIDVSSIRNEVERYVKNLVPVRARLAYTFGAEMKETAKQATAGIFMPAKGSRLDISVAASVDFTRPQDVKFEAKGVLGRFAIKLVGDLVDAVTINFHGATFTLSGGSGPQLNVMYDDFVIGPALEYVQKLQKMLGPKDGSGFYLLPRLQPLGIEAGYGLGLPIITLGNVSFSNISLNAAVVIPFDGSDARFRASLSRRDAPFTIAVAPYGGSGFFAIEANAEGIVGFEASFEFGGAAAFQFGPLSGIGRLMLGVYIKQTLIEVQPTTPGGKVTKRRSTEISATFYVGGAAAIWIFTFGASLYVRLGMKDGNMTGIAIFTFSFSMGIVDYDYSVSVERTENKMGNGQQASVPGLTRVAALGNETFMKRAMTRNEFNSWITNCTKCQGVDWPTYRSYFDRSIVPPTDDLFGDAA